MTCSATWAYREVQTRCAVQYWLVEKVTIRASPLVAVETAITSYTFEATAYSQVSKAFQRWAVAVT